MRVMFLLLREERSSPRGRKNHATVARNNTRKRRLRCFTPKGNALVNAGKTAGRRSPSKPTTDVRTLYLILQHAFLRTAANMAAAYLQRF